MSHSLGYVFERYVPELFFLSTVVLAYLFPENMPGNTKDLATSFAAIFAVFLGFITTSISIFFSAQDKPFVKSMKTSGAFSMIVNYHHLAIIWCSIAVFVSLVCTVICQDCEHNSIGMYIKTTMFATSAAAFISMVRVGYFYKKIILID